MDDLADLNLDESTSIACQRDRDDFDAAIQDEKLPPFADPKRFAKMALDREILVLQARQAATGDEVATFSDVDWLVLLCGTSPQPLLLSARWIRPKQILLVHGRGGEGPRAATEFEDLASPLGIDIKRCSIEESDPTQSYAELVAGMRHRGIRPGPGVLIDVTGGKKTMVAAAFLVASQLGLDIAYVDGEYSEKARLPRPYTARIKRLTDPMFAFRVRELAETRTLAERLRFADAAERFKEIARSLERLPERLHTLLPRTPDEVRRAAAAARALAAWNAGDYVLAKSTLADQAPEALNALAADWQATEPAVDRTRNRLKAFSQTPMRLVRFCADRLAWARRHYVAGATQDGFLRTYSACDAAVEGLVMRLCDDKKIDAAGAKDWRALVEAAGSAAAAGNILRCGRETASVKVTGFSGLGEPYAVLSSETVRTHRNHLVHGVAMPDVGVTDRLVSGADVELLRAVAHALGTGTSGDTVITDAISGTSYEDVLAPIAALKEM